MANKHFNRDRSLRRLLSEPLGGLMRASRAVFVSGIIAATLSGCVAPGSSFGRLSVSGSLAAEDGTPLSNREIQLLLPGAYGLGSLDLVLDTPEDFGHQDQVFTVRTGPDGKFTHDLGDRIYHMSFWLIPPLGGFPRHPPAPFLLLRALDAPGEYYAVQTQDGKFRIYTDNGAELAISKATLSSLSAHKDSGKTDEVRWTAGIIDLVLGIEAHAAQQGVEPDVE